MRIFSGSAVQLFSGLPFIVESSGAVCFFSSKTQFSVKLYWRMVKKKTPKQNTTTLELSSVRHSTTALYWLPFLDSIDEQVIVVQPVSSALQRQQLYHRAQAEGAFTFWAGATLQQPCWRTRMWTQEVKQHIKQYVALSVSHDLKNWIRNRANAANTPE